MTTNKKITDTAWATLIKAMKESGMVITYKEDALNGYLGVCDKDYNLGAWLYDKDKKQITFQAM